MRIYLSKMGYSYQIYPKCGSVAFKLPYYQNISMASGVLSTTRNRKETYVILGFKKTSFDCYLRLFRGYEYRQDEIVTKWKNEGVAIGNGTDAENEEFKVNNEMVEYLKDQFFAFKTFLKKCPSQTYYPGRNHSDDGLYLVREEDYDNNA